MEDDRSSPRLLAGRIAAFGLRAEESPIEIPPEDWPGVFRVLVAETLTGFAAAAAEAGALRLSDAQADELERAHREATVWTLALERMLVRACDAIGGAGIEPVVLKGVALAHTFYPDPAWRPFTDADLLVRKRDWRGALAVLERLGFRRELPEPRAGFDERFGKAAVLIDGDGLPIDLHRTLVLGAHGVWLDPDWLFARTAPLAIGGRALRRLDDTAMLVHVCMHASLGWRPPQLKPLRDVLQVAWRGTVDWGEMRAAAARWRLRSVIRHALITARDMLGVELPLPAVEMLRALGESRRERRALAAYATSKRSRGGTLRSTFWALPGVRLKVALLRDLLLPDASFLAARAADGARPSYLKRMGTPLRWLLRRPG